MPLTQLRGICYGLQLTPAVFHLTSELVLLTGLEPAFPSLQGMCNSQLYESSINLEHPEGIEPSTSVWKTVIFPFLALSNETALFSAPPNNGKPLTVTFRFAKLMF